MANIAVVCRILNTPYIAFKAQKIEEDWSLERPLCCDIKMSQQVAQPLFDAGVKVAALGARRNYSSGETDPRPCHYMFLMLQERMHLVTGDREYDLKPGDLAVCPAGVPFSHCIGSAGAWRIYFEISDIPEWAPLKKHGACVRPCRSAALIFTLLCDILDAGAAYESVEIHEALESSRMLASLLRLEMLRSNLDQSSVSAAIQALVSAVCEAPWKKWDLDTIAARVGYTSLHSFTRIFHKCQGMPPGLYRAALRPQSGRESDY